MMRGASSASALTSDLVAVVLWKNSRGIFASVSCPVAMPRIYYYNVSRLQSCAVISWQNIGLSPGLYVKIGSILIPLHYGP